MTSAPERRIRSRVRIEILRRSRGCGCVVDIARHQDGIYLVGLDQFRDFAKDRRLLVEPVAALEGLADVPVRGVQELHDAPFLSSS
jgi:hypothetical protein